VDNLTKNNQHLSNNVLTKTPNPTALNNQIILIRKTMCGRFALYSQLDAIKKMCKFLDNWEKYAPTWNAGPGQTHPIITKQAGEYSLIRRNWGFKAFDSNNAPLVVNTRVESLSRRDYLKNYKLSTCIIPVDGFYEWDKEKQPYYCHYKDNKLMFLTGINAIDHLGRNSFSIITKDAELNLEKIHHRMPVILSEENILQWLDVDNISVSISKLRPIITELIDYPVAKKVNAIRNDSPDLIDEVLPIKQMTLEDFL
jgi:putative SOS response-associated peptidase YedK